MKASPRSAISKRGRERLQVASGWDEAFDAAGGDSLQVVAEVELVEEEAGELGSGIGVRAMLCAELPGIK